MKDLVTDIKALQEETLKNLQRNDISYTVIEPKKKEFVIKSYADNFLKD